MELLKRNIQTMQIKCQGSMQFVLDNDFNVPDSKADIRKIVKGQGEVRIDEMGLADGKLQIKGALKFNFLYISEDTEMPVSNIQGELSLDERIHLEDTCSESQISLIWEIEELAANPINSRKLNVRAILRVIYQVGFGQMKEAALEVIGEGEAEQNFKSISVSKIAIQKKDTFRIKDEVHLPVGKPNIDTMLYYEMGIMGNEIRLLDDKISLRGTMNIFVIYMGEEEGRIQYIETEIPYSSVLECEGCGEDMISDISMTISKKDLQVKADEDGEQRIIEIEAVPELSMLMYEEEEMMLLQDMYAVDCNLTPVRESISLENVVVKNKNKLRLTERVKMKPNEPPILQICTISGILHLGETGQIASGIQATGELEAALIYVTSEDRMPIHAVRAMLPFDTLIEVKDMSVNSRYSIRPSLEQISVILLDSTEVEIKATIELETLVMDQLEEEIIIDWKAEPIGEEVMEKSPGLTVYTIKPGDTLWNIGKKFYTTVDKIKEMNPDLSERLPTGERIILLKEFGQMN